MIHGYTTSLSSHRIPIPLSPKESALPPYGFHSFYCLGYDVVTNSRGSSLPSMDLLLAQQFVGLSERSYPQRQDYGPASQIATEKSSRIATASASSQIRCLLQPCMIYCCNVCVHDNRQYQPNKAGDSVNIQNAKKLSNPSLQWERFDCECETKHFNMGIQHSKFNADLRRV